MKRPRTRLRRLVPPLAGMGVAGALTVGLTLAPTTAAFTATTGDGGNRVTTRGSFCTAPGPVTPPLARDSAIAENSAATNYSATEIGVRTGLARDAYTLLKFTIPAAPQHCVITAATLHVYSRTPSAPATINASRASVAWSNANTWSTLPRPAPAGTPVPTAASPTAGWLSWPVTTLVQEMVVGPDYGFLLKDSVDHNATTRQQVWESAESYPTRAPYLEITWG